MFIDRMIVSDKINVADLDKWLVHHVRYYNVTLRELYFVVKKRVSLFLALEHCRQKSVVEHFVWDDFGIILHAFQLALVKLDCLSWFDPTVV